VFFSLRFLLACDLTTWVSRATFIVLGEILDGFAAGFRLSALNLRAFRLGYWRS